MHRRMWTLLLSAIFLGGAGWARAAKTPGGKPPEMPRAGVPAGRLARLSHGINLGANRYQPSAVFPESLFREIRAAGVSHVRLPVVPNSLFDEGHPETPRPEGLRALDSLLDRILASGLAVSVDMHDPDPRLWNDTAYADRFATFWGALAKHLARRDPERLFLETANEPQSDTPERWREIQGKLLAAMRRGAPRHTLIATGNMLVAPGQWDALKVLQTFEPYADRNIVYTFHYYDPFVFTHQGATWTWEGVRNLKGVPYPSSPEALAPLVEKSDGQARGILENYGRERWDAAKIRDGIRPYRQWADQHKVPIYCGEFGAFKAVSPAPDRARWTRDTRAALESLGIPWTAWDDGGGFGITYSDNGTWRLDHDSLIALGFTVKP